MRLSRILIAAAPLALAACGGDAPADDGRSATGEVLEGTISDAMLPTDRVRSEAPLAPEPAARGEGSAAQPDADPTAAVEGEAPAEAIEVPAALATPPAAD